MNRCPQIKDCANFHPAVRFSGSLRKNEPQRLKEPTGWCWIEPFKMHGAACLIGCPQALGHSEWLARVGRVASSATTISSLSIALSSNALQDC